MKASKCLITDTKPSFIYILWTWNILDRVAVWRIFVCETGKSETDGSTEVGELPFSLISMITMQKKSNIWVLGKTIRSVFSQTKDRQLGHENY